MALVALALQDMEFELRLALGAQLHLEDLALPIGGQIQRIIIAPALPGQVFWTNDPEPCAHPDELILYRFRVHILTEIAPLGAIV